MSKIIDGKVWAAVRDIHDGALALGYLRYEALRKCSLRDVNRMWEACLWKGKRWTIWLTS